MAVCGLCDTDRKWNNLEDFKVDELGGSLQVAKKEGVAVSDIGGTFVVSVSVSGVGGTVEQSRSGSTP